MLGFSYGTERSRGTSDGGQTRGAEGTRVPEGGTAAPMEPQRSKVDVFLETGLTPEKFIIEKIDSHGGSLKQQAIIDITGWSAGAVSNLLLEMEDAGSIQRVWIGREKLVYLPGAKPDPVAAPETDEARPR